MNENDAAEAAERLMLELDEWARMRGLEAGALVIAWPPEARKVPAAYIGWQQPGAQARLADALVQECVVLGTIGARPQAPDSPAWQTLSQGLARVAGKELHLEILRGLAEQWTNRLLRLPTVGMRRVWYRFG